MAWEGGFWISVTIAKHGLHLVQSKIKLSHAISNIKPDYLRKYLILPCSSGKISDLSGKYLIKSTAWLYRFNLVSELHRMFLE